LTIWRQNPYFECQAKFIKNIIRCNPKFYGEPRYDWIALYDWEDLIKRKEDVYGLDEFKIGQIHLLFTIEQGGTIHHLAYIQWFEISNQRDPDTQMSIATRTQKFNVIGIDAIVRNIHLIPFFESQNSARTAQYLQKNIYSFDKYLVNHYSDREAWEMFY